MPFVTTLSLASGDRAALDGVVDEIRARAERKGIEFKGPHTHPPEDYRVPQYRRLTAGDGRRFDPWSYTVYERTVRIVGREDAARRIVDLDVPRSVHVAIEVEQVRSAGSG